MPCYHPMRAYKTAAGDVVFQEMKRHGEIVQTLDLPCGQCIGCKLTRSSHWGMRCMHEAAMHKRNSVITLTYDDEHLPERGQLNHRDFQLFMKRLRKHSGLKVRFFMGGEYGERLDRPHFHACLFGWDFDDMKPWQKTEAGTQLYRSEKLEKLWPNGHSTIGRLTYEAAAYIARYCLTKVNGDKKESHYKRFDEKGEYQKNPEYGRMSLKPGIGATWLEKYWTDVYDHDRVVHKGIETKAPKYYDKLLKRKDKSQLEEFKTQREYRATLKEKGQQTPQRLKDRETVQLAKIETLLRGKIK